MKCRINSNLIHLRSKNNWNEYLWFNKNDFKGMNKFRQFQISYLIIKFWWSKRDLVTAKFWSRLQYIFLLNHDKHLVVYFLWFCPDGTTTTFISKPQLVGHYESWYAISSSETVPTKDFQRHLATSLQRLYTIKWTDRIAVGPPGGE